MFKRVHHMWLAKWRDAQKGSDLYIDGLFLFREDASMLMHLQYAISRSSASNLLKIMLGSCQCHFR